MQVYRAALPALGDLLARIEASVDSAPLEIRLAVQRLDVALRQVRGLGDRPYRLADPDERAAIDYSGPRLSARQRREVLDYVDWIRHRDAAR